jgi:hypothetical protein
MTSHLMDLDVRYTHPIPSRIEKSDRGLGRFQMPVIPPKLTSMKTQFTRSLLPRSDIIINLWLDVTT